MTFQEFLDKYTGKTKGYPDDSQYLGECLSIVKLYIKECFNIDPPPSGSNSAYGYWSNFPNPLGSVFDKIVNTPTGVPQKGDVVIWNTKVGGGFGHIDIFIEGDVNSFTGFDQNWIGKAAHLQKHSYDNVVGWLHPKASVSDPSTVFKYTEEQMTTVRLRRDKNWTLYQGELDFIEMLCQKVVGCDNSHEAFEARLKELAKADAQREDAIKAASDQKKAFDQERAELNRQIKTLQGKVEQQQRENEVIAQQLENLQEKVNHVDEKEEVVDKVAPPEPTPEAPISKPWYSKLLDKILAWLKG